jgi:hypothetical protein
MKKALRKLVKSIVNGCASLRIQDDDHALVSCGKVTARILLGICTLGWSEAEFKTYSREAKLKKTLDAWIGTPINQLISCWGYPENSFTAPNGNTVYVFKSESMGFVPAHTYFNYYGATTYGGFPVYYSGQIFFEVDQLSNKTVRWFYNCNTCY